MLEATVRVSNRLGLHARAAAKLVRLANTFRCRVTIDRHDTAVTADAKDILSVLQLAAGHGVEIRIVADGVDEQDALDQITKLVADKFGED